MQRREADKRKWSPNSRKYVNIVFKVSGREREEEKEKKEVGVKEKRGGKAKSDI